MNKKIDEKIKEVENRGYGLRIYLKGKTEPIFISNTVFESLYDVSEVTDGVRYINDEIATKIFEIIYTKKRC